MPQRSLTRRRLLQIATAAVATAAGLAAAGQSAPARAATTSSAAGTRPNFLFIFTDDQRYDALGCVNPHARTPHMDALAARGVRFSNAFVTLSICSPSRAAVLTGLYGSANGVTTLGTRIREHLPTFASRLRQAGWRTGMAGKWHLGNTPAEVGFDEHRYFTSNGAYYNRQVVVGGKKQKVPGFIDDWVADQAVDFMTRAAADRKPFVLWMCTQVPHMDHTMDWNPRKETLQRFDQDKMPLPATWNDDLAGKPPYLKTARSRTQAATYGYDKPEGIRCHWHRYLAALSEVDASVGRALDALKRLGLEDSTYVLLMGDNGWFLGEHGFTSKVLPYEESIRVPMVVAGPGIQPGVDDHLVLNIDLPATMYDWAGLPAPPMHGRSLRPILERRADAAWRERFLYESPQSVLGACPLYAVRDGRWKYVRTFDLKDRDKLVFEELYDLQADPHETTNLAGRPGHAERQKAMAQAMRSLRLEAAGVPGPP
ncbi:MAG TPA: sulfatase-like hydrolase/transferase [Phycisphaerae bacterium]|nr:sulfatase-like hydrolase/transferase [Phycisphaerae bacterium]